MPVIKTDIDLSGVFGKYVFDSYKVAVEFVKVHPDYSLLKFRDVLSALVKAMADQTKLEFSTQKLYDQINYLSECQVISHSLRSSLHEVRVLGNKGAHAEIPKDLGSQFLKERKLDLIEKASRARDVMIEIFNSLFLFFNRDDALPNVEKVEIRYQEYKDFILKALLSEESQDKVQAGIILEKMAIESAPKEIAIVSQSFYYHYESLYKIAASFFEAAYKISANVDERMRDLSLDGDFNGFDAVTRNYGDLESLYRFSVLASDGHLGEDRKTLGSDLMRVAADRSYAPAQSHYGASLYLESNYEDSEKYLLEAEKQDDPLALRFLFKYFSEGEACQADCDRAMEYLERGIKIGCPDCLSELGKAYHKGVGVPKDDEKAESILQEAIESGSIAAKIYYTVEFNDLPGKMADYLFEIGQQLQKATKASKRQPKTSQKKIGANDLCPCGSGNKYKRCCRDKKPDLFLDRL